MKVEILIHAPDRIVSWSELTDDEKANYREKLNQQCAKTLGYKRTDYK